MGKVEERRTRVFAVEAHLEKKRRHDVFTPLGSFAQSRDLGFQQGKKPVAASFTQVVSRSFGEPEEGGEERSFFAPSLLGSAPLQKASRLFFLPLTFTYLDLTK